MHCEMGFTEQQVPRQYEKFNLLAVSASKFFLWHVQNKGFPFLIVRNGAASPF